MANPVSNIKTSLAYLGINGDAITSQIKEGQLSFALNAVVENFDGHTLTYQNEASNTLCLDFGDFRVIGAKNIVEQNRTIFFLLNPYTGVGQIVTKPDDQCEYSVLMEGVCLGFDIRYPIHKVIVKITNCATQLYWTDNYNPPRWINLDDLPFKEIPDPNNPAKKIKVLGQMDCNKILVQPDFSIPVITPIAWQVGGDLQMGTYQFAIQYANSLGEGYSSYYGITNAVAIYERKFTQNFDLFTSKAISIAVTDLDNSGLYEHFNLAVIKTINNITSVELAGTYPITGETFKTLYTGNTVSSIRLSVNDIFERFPYYSTARDVTSSDNSLLWAGLTVNQKINYQQIWASVRLLWETWKLPYNEFEGYNNPVNTALYKGYMGDEVYAFEGCFVLKNGKITESFHIPGRQLVVADMDEITGADAIVWNKDTCAIAPTLRRWQVYNTASITGFSDQYLSEGNQACYAGPYQYGNFGYWESEERYPDNEFIWKTLAGKPIRHHRFPDSTLCPIHDNNTSGDPTFEHSIYPKGVRIDAASLYAAIEASGLSRSEKDDIVGFKIVRGNRATAKSVIAKGLFYNVGSYSYNSTDYFYPNYPFNDLRPDPFLAAQKISPDSGLNPGHRLNGFSSDDSRCRFTFHSPDTSFYQPFGIDEGYIKMETVAYGKAASHFVEVKDNAKYKFLTPDASRVAFAAGMASVITLDVGGGLGLQAFDAHAGLQLGSVIPSFESTLTVLKNITPALNYGWQLNATGDYGNSISVPRSGNSIRRIDMGAYLAPGMQNVGDTKSINNLRRESSVYIKVAGGLPFPHEVSPSISPDNSRYLISDMPSGSSPYEIVNRNICAYYGAIKKVVADQYGRIYSYETIDTGFYSRLQNPTGGNYTDFNTIFGGDIFINRFALKKKFPFFIDDTVGKAEGTDINLDDLSNVAYPMFWYSTKPVDLDADFTGLEDEIHTLTDTGFWTILGNLVSGGTRPLKAGFTILNKLFSAYVKVLGVANLNLDTPGSRNLNKLGKAYLYAYGIPYFFTESEVNVDLRQAINTMEGNFFPAISTSIPDDWLQETRIPIANDNSYVYNKSFSKQNKETFFSHLPEDWDPDRACLTHFDNRVIFSEKSHLEETKNNWLIYRPVSYYDLTKSNGPLCAIDGLEEQKLLIRFANKSLLYNVYSTIDTNTSTAYLGNPNFFSQPPLDFADTDLGYFGSQHKIMVKTPFGHLSIDALRGKVFLLKGNQVDDISAQGLSYFLAANLPFNISKQLPAYNTDNSFRDVGLTATFDYKYNRLLITKRDFIPLNTEITSSGGDLYFRGAKVNTDDPSLFCNVSWTLSYCFHTGSWISFHSYVPNYYIPHPVFFESGLGAGVWKHNTAITFGKFYDSQQDYILEYPLAFISSEEIIGSIYDYTTALRYANADVFSEPEELIYFNKAIIYNDAQCTGILNLVPKPAGNIRAYLQYPKLKVDSKDILVSRSDHLVTFNQFWDIVMVKGSPFYQKPCNLVSLDKTFSINLDYRARSHGKARIRSREARLRLIYNQSDRYKLLSKFLLTETQKSYK